MRPVRDDRLHDLEGGLDAGADDGRLRRDVSFGVPWALAFMAMSAK